MVAKIEEKRKKELVLLLAEERESKRIARELHHDLHQALSLINDDFSRAIRQIENDQIKLGMDLFKTTVQKIQQVAARVQKMGMHIWPPILNDLGILEAVAWFCKEFQEAHPRIRINLQTEIREGDVSEFLKSVVYRILKTALSNVAEHSEAELVHFYLAKRNSRIEMVIKDNGRGFDLKKGQRGLGLESMRGWVRISGGSFRIESVEGEGTTIIASWPLARD